MNAAKPSASSLIGVTSSMLVWMVWFVAVYALTGLGCRAGWNRLAVPGGNLLTLVMVLSALLALALIAWRGRIGVSTWRAATRGEVRGQDAAQRQRFIGMATAVLAVLAALGTLFTAVPMLMLDPCAGPGA